MSRLTGSVAASAFATAHEVLDGSAPGPVDRPATDYVLGAPSPPRSAHLGAGDGAISAALRDQREGRTTARELLEAALAAGEAHAHLGGFVAVDADGARARADELDQLRAGGHPIGPLHGIPVSVKDVIDVAGLPTRAGSAAYSDHPTVDASAVGRLRAAGAIVFAKAATHEFALGVTSPQCRNPHDPDRIPGGSSGGSAVAVATGAGLASLGTDTRASIRVPAALSGTVGLKGTYGAVPTDGVVSLSWTMDHVAPMAATVDDAACVLDVLTGAQPRRTLGGLAADVDLTGLRVGVPAAAFAGAEDGVDAAVRAALGRLAEEGCAITDAARPDAGDLGIANAAGLLVSRCEAAAFHRSLGLDRSLYWEEVADQLEEAERIPATDYLDAQRVRRRLTTSMLAVFDHVDLLAMPTVPVLAPRRADFARFLMVLARNAIPWSFTGLPAISVPCGSVGGLPVGIQFVAAPWNEHLLVAAGRAVEAARC